MTNAEKTAQLEKLKKPFTDFLDECGIHYRIVLAGNDGKDAFEYSSLTGVERMTDIICSVLAIMEKANIDSKTMLKIIEGGIEVAKRENHE